MNWILLKVALGLLGVVCVGALWVFILDALRDSRRIKKLLADLERGDKEDD